MKRNKHFFMPFTALFALIFTVSCTDFGDENPDRKEDYTQGTPVEVGLVLRIADELSADGSVIPITRAPLDVEEDKIYNVWVFQFNGPDDNATLVCPPYYIDDATMNEAEQDAAPGMPAILPMPLIDSEGAEHRLVFIANINDRSFSWNLQIGQGTYGDLKSRYLNLSNESPTYGIDRKNLIMAGSAVTPITPAILVDGDEIYNTDNGDGVPMTRSLACIDLELKVSAAGFKVVSVQLRSVSLRLNYFDALLGLEDDRIYPATAATLDYAAEVDMNGLVTDDGNVKNFRWYVPRNTRGTSPTSISPLTKNAHASKGATFFDILAEDSNGKGIIYRIYPGANDRNDFNVIPNHKYSISLNITGDGGDNSLDTRIEKYSDIIFSGNSNCYMLNPPLPGFGAREFKIPVSQVNRYWRHSYEGYGGMNQHALDVDDKWIVDLLWQDAADIVRDENAGDYDQARHISISKNTGMGGDDHFTVKVPTNAIHGNFVVVIRKLDVNNNIIKDILWSWHFWVTDYNPDPRFVAVRGEQFIYPVTGGHVDRYFGTRFGYSSNNSSTGDINSYNPTVTSTASLAQSVVMDRNLGALNLNYVGSSARGNIFYQYGRKDPFPGNITLYKIDGNPIPSASPDDFPQQYWKSSDANRIDAITLNDNNQIVYSIQNPMRFLSSTWQGTSNVAYGWNDPQSTDKTNYLIKSIYDPCPEGWRMMPADAMDDFRLGSGNFPTVGDDSRNLPYTQNDAQRYYPYIMENGVDYAAAECMIFPPHGQRSAGSAGFNSNMGTTFYTWFGSSNGATQGQLKSIGPNAITTSNTPRSMGNAVRCVSE